jgi:hypothetical protein
MHANHLLSVPIIVIVIAVLIFTLVCPVPVGADKPPPPSTPSGKTKPPPPSPPDDDGGDGGDGGGDSDGGDKAPPPPTPTSEGGGGEGGDVKPTAPPTPVTKPTAPSTPAVKPTAPPTPESDPASAGNSGGSGGETGGEGETPPPTSTPVPSTPTPTAMLSPTATPTPTPTPTPMPVINGRVFEDRDGDGAQGPGEPGVGGVPVTLDNEVVGASDADGSFSIPLPGGGRGMLAVVPPEGWQWSGESLAAAAALEIGVVVIPLRRVEATITLPSSATTTITGGLIVIALIAALAFNGFSGLAQTAAVQNLARIYRREKGLELEQLQAQAVAQRRHEVTGLLAQEDGWRQVIDQLLADALPDSADRVTDEGVLDLSLTPAPRFTVVGPNQRSYLFTTSPEALRRVRMLSRRDRAIPIDAALHPAARVEVQAVWEHLARTRLRTGWSGKTGTLPRQAEWFLVVRAQQPRKAGK